MNTRLLLVALSIAGMSSCSTAYRTGQTPDDVYYSPERHQDAYVVTNNDRNDGRRYNDNSSGSNFYESRDDMYLRMMVRNRNRWSSFDNYYMMDSYYNPHMFYTNPWSYNYNPWSYNYYNNFYSWNSFYNPYCGNIVVVNPGKNPTYYNKIKTFNLNAYNNNAYSNGNAAYRGKNFNRPGVNPAYGVPYGSPSYNNTNANQRTSGNGGKTYRYNNSNSRTYDYNSGSDRPVRTYSPSNSQPVERSSSSGGSSSGGRSSGGSSGGGGGSTGSRPGRG